MYGKQVHLLFSGKTECFNARERKERKKTPRLERAGGNFGCQGLSDLRQGLDGITWVLILI